MRKHIKTGVKRGEGEVSSSILLNKHFKDKDFACADIEDVKAGEIKR